MKKKEEMLVREKKWNIIGEQQLTQFISAGVMIENLKQVLLS